MSDPHPGADMTAETVSDEDVSRAAEAFRTADDVRIAHWDLRPGLRAALAADRAARHIDWPRVRVAVQSQSVATAVRKVLAECGHMASDATALAVADAVVQAAARGKEAGR